jgi:hypothetical protein
VTDKEIEQKLSLWGAGRPKTVEGQLALQAADVISKLRAELKYERARSDLNDHTEELRELYEKNKVQQ